MADFEIEIPDELSVLEFCVVQRRRHKKRRINKKWLKRFGTQMDVYKNNKLLARDVSWRTSCVSSTEYTSSARNIDFMFEGMVE